MTGNIKSQLVNGLTQFCLGLGLPYGIYVFTYAMDRRLRMALICIVMLILSYIFIGMNRRLDVDRWRRREALVDEYIKGTGPGRLNIVFHASQRIGAGDDRAALSTWLRSLGVPDSVHGDIFCRGFVMANPAFAGTGVPSPKLTWLSRHGWNLLIVPSIVCAALGALIGSYMLIGIGAAGWWYGQELAEKSFALVSGR